MLDELGRDSACFTAMFPRLPQRRIGGRTRNEIARTQLDASHRFRQVERRQLLSEQLCEVLRVGGRRGEAQHTTCARHLPMLQKTGDLGDAALAHLQELTQLVEQRRQRRENGVVMLQLLQQIFLATESLAQAELITQIRISPGEPIQLGQLLPAETTREPGTRQPQCLTHGVDADLLQTLDHFGRPAQREQFQRGDFTDQAS